MIGPVFHSPARLRAGLLCTEHPAIFDVETTGLNVFQDRVLSFGFRLRTANGYENHVLFTARCPHASIQPYVSSDEVIRETLGALARPGLVLVGHNVQYDFPCSEPTGSNLSTIACNFASLSIMDFGARNAMSRLWR